MKISGRESPAAAVSSFSQYPLYGMFCHSTLTPGCIASYFGMISS